MPMVGERVDKTMSTANNRFYVPAADYCLELHDYITSLWGSPPGDVDFIVRIGSRLLFIEAKRQITEKPGEFCRKSECLNALRCAGKEYDRAIVKKHFSSLLHFWSLGYEAVGDPLQKHYILLIENDMEGDPKSRRGLRNRIAEAGLNFKGNGGIFSILNEFHVMDINELQSEFPEITIEPISTQQEHKQA